MGQQYRKRFIIYVTIHAHRHNERGRYKISTIRRDQSKTLEKSDSSDGKHRNDLIRNNLVYF